eukprot:7389363-Prymnesium_polylepis.1
MKLFLSTQAVGVFFDSPPMFWYPPHVPNPMNCVRQDPCTSLDDALLHSRDRRYGDSPLAFACVFGLRNLVRRMLDTKCISLDADRCGELLGFHPVHAVAANGMRSM